MNTKTLHDLHMLITNYVEASHKIIKNSSSSIVEKLKKSETYSDNELKKVAESGDVISFLIDNDVEVFGNKLREISKQMHEYIDFLTDLKNLMTRKGKAIYEKTEYILNESKKNNLFTGGTPNESKKHYKEKLKESYDKYYQQFTMYKRLKFTIDENILTNHQYKFENLLTIYQYLDNMSNILQTLDNSILNILITILYLNRYIALDKMKIYILFVVKIKKEIPKESFVVLLKQIKQDYKNYIKVMKERDPVFHKDVTQFEEFLQDTISQATPSIAENIHDKIISILKKNKVNVAYSLNNKLLNTITKYQQPKSADIDKIHNDVVQAIDSTRRKHFLPDKIKTDLHSAIQKSVLSPILSKSNSKSSIGSNISNHSNTST